MSKATKIENKTFVDSILVDDLSNDDLLFKIEAASNEVARLEKLGLKSAAVDDMIAKQKARIDGLVGILDGRVNTGNAKAK